MFLTTLVTGKLGAINWGEAGVVVTIVPCLVIFLVLQRYYVRGLMSGAVLSRRRRRSGRRREHHVAVGRPHER